MKKLASLAVVVLVLFACGTIDKGYFGDPSVPENKRVTLYISGDIQVGSFDGQNPNWERGGMDSCLVTNREMKVMFAAGEHVLSVRYYLSYASGAANYTGYQMISFNFVESKTYIVKPKIEGSLVRFLVEEYNP